MRIIILVIFTVFFSFFGNSQITFSGSIKLCQDQTLRLVASDDSIYSWAKESSPSIIISSTNVLEDNPTFSQNYYLYGSSDTLLIEVSVGSSDCDCQVYIPNIFTPDGDFFNDNFEPIINCDILGVRTTVYDRTNRVVFDSNDLEPSWDGSFEMSNEPLQVGVYPYVITILKANGETQAYEGFVILAL